MTLSREQQPAVLTDAGRRTRRKLQMLQNFFGCVLTGVKLGGSAHGHPTRECEAHDGKYLSPECGYVQTCLTAGGWTRAVTDSKLLMLSAWFFVKGFVTQSSWCQPRSTPVKDLVPAPEFCHYWAKQSLLLSSWPILFQLLWNPYPWKQFFHWLHGLFLIVSVSH